MADARVQRNTRQRAAVAGLMHAGDHFRTAQQVHDALREQGASVGLTTVYRTLQAMADGGEVDVLRTPEGELSYRRCAPGHHHHLVCRSCGRTVEVAGEAIERWAAQVAEEHGFSQIDHDIELFGLCRECAARGDS